MTYRFAPLLLVLLASAAGAAMEAEGATPGTKHNIPVTASPVRNPDVAYDATNDVYLAVTGNSVVQGQFVSATGALLGSRFNLSTNSSLYQHSPRVRCEEGVCLAVWHEGSPVVTKARIITYASGPIGVPVPLGPEKSAWEFGAGIAFSPGANEFLVTWMGDFPALNNIYYARVNKSGQVLQTTALTTSSAYEREPSVAYNPVSDEFVIAYAGTFFVNGVERAYVSAQRIKAGAKVGGPIQLDTAGSTYIPQAEYNPATESVVIGWYRSAKIYGREVKANGTLGPLTILSGTYAAYDGLDIAHNANTSTFLLVTHSSGVENAAVEISQSLVPAPAFILTSNGGNGNYTPKLVSSTADPKWLSITSRNFSSIWVTFALGQACTSNCGGSGGGGGGGGEEPPPSGTLNLTGLTSSPTPPVQTGTAITWTGVASSTGTVEYQFWLYNGSSWSVTQAWAQDNTWVWTPSTAGTYAVQVWARLQGQTTHQMKSSGFFTVTAPSAPSGSLTLNSLTSGPSLPQPANTTITWTGNATVGGGGTAEYQFWLYSAASGSWSVARAWATGNTWGWTPTTAGQYAVQVWARLQGQTAHQVKASGFFNITQPTTPTGTLALTGLLASPSLPQPANTAITWTGTATVGGGGTAEYQFWVYSDATKTWTIGQAWSASNSWVWTPTAAGTYAVQVWARLVGTTPHQYRSSGFFTISPAASGGTLALAGISADPVPPFVVNTPVTFRGLASVTGGATEEYQFWVYSAATGSWTVARAWDASDSWVWTPTVAGTYAVQVWVRLVGTIPHQYASTGFFSVTTTESEVARVQITSFTSTPSAPFVTGVPVTWGAAATGASSLQYAFWVYSAATNTWTNTRAYSSTSSYIWTPPAPGTYAVQVWVRRSGSTLAYEDYRSSGFFTVN